MKYQIRLFADGTRAVAVWTGSEYRVCQMNDDGWCAAPGLVRAGELSATHFGPATFGHVEYYFVPGRGRIIAETDLTEFRAQVGDVLGLVLKDIARLQAVAGQSA